MGPPDSCWPLQLMGCILYLHGFSDSQQAKLLLNGIQSLICFERFFCLFEDGGLSVLRILEGAILIWFRPLVLLVDTSGILHNEAQCFFHRSLIPQELREKFIHGRWRWWWQVTIIATNLAGVGTSACARHLQNCNNK